MVGTRVRESQMTCVCVGVTTSPEVGIRRHRDDRGEEHKRTAKTNNEHGPAERLTAPGSRVGFAERDAS